MPVPPLCDMIARHRQEEHGNPGTTVKYESITVASLSPTSASHLPVAVSAAMPAPSSMHSPFPVSSPHALPLNGASCLAILSLAFHSSASSHPPNGASSPLRVVRPRSSADYPSTT
ncbi:hypothetical protein Hypma_004114 [Hypsizygus marmoreus]|uniref:Uncharacterized protein n=1 Tax=Hypsizygus marmoreus TaxID=39966 RepID=A0A369K3U7_HYPMA|nr:hypothetical protein Hypma_004114 [Hypsizygus marmoreus]